VEPNALTTMSEAEQVAWLVERILQRSERPGMIRETLYEWFPRLRTRHTLDSDDLTILAQVCAKYDLAESLRRLQSWARTTDERDALYQAEAQILAKQREWQRALEIIRRIHGAEARVRAYCTLATEQARTGQHEAAHRTLLEALGVVSSSAAGGEWLAKTAAQLRFPDVAEQATRRGARPELRDLTLTTHVAPAYAFAGKNSEAVRIAREVHDPVTRGLAYAEIAGILIERGQSAQAIALIEHAKEPVGYARAARYLAERGYSTQARAFWHKATEFANRLPEPTRSRSLAQIAIEHASAGDPETASRVLQQAKQAIRSPEVAIARFGIASAYATQGRRAEAVVALLSSEESSALLVTYYAQVASELYQHGYAEDARRVLQMMRAYLKRHFPDWYSALEWAHAVRVLASRKDTLPLARELVAGLETETQSITAPDKRFAIDRRLAELHAHTGNIPKAVHYAARLTKHDEQTGCLIEILGDLLTRKSEW
jgi:tetratricopeptide (TPR) repeat protein